MLDTPDHCELLPLFWVFWRQSRGALTDSKEDQCRLLTEGVGNVRLVARKHETGPKRASRMTTCYATYKTRLGVESPLGNSRWEMSLVLGRAF